MVIELNERLAEITGNIIGDGCLYHSKYKRLVMMSGNIKDDKEFYEDMQKFIFELTGKEPKIKIHQRALRLIIQNKVFYEFFVEGLGMKYNGDKTYRVSIPQKITSNDVFVKACLRGIVDTDGSVFVAKKPGVPRYPSIEITTVSKNLAFQIEEILKKYGYRVRLRFYDPKNSVQVRTYKLALNGWNMLKKWNDEIGFSHPIKKALAENILKEKFGGAGVI